MHGTTTIAPVADLSVRWPLPDRTDLRDRLLTAYSSRRGYHDATHLAEVIDRLEELGRGDDAVLLLAAWFHDAVYDGRPDAEERSAELAETELAETELAAEGVDGVDVAEVARLVRLTEHHAPDAGDERGETLCDADLAILAADPARYRDYAAGVREDYAAYSDAEFRAGRLAVLEELAAREGLFRTPYGREHWEPRARENLAAEISALR